ncbi:MAG: hypothetical protein ACI93P_002381 [bacterium]|jgi:hypothetical protein
MKDLIKFFALFFTISLISQTWTEAIALSGGSAPLNFSFINGPNNTTLVGNEFEWSKVNGVLAEFDDIDLENRNIIGSVYLFDTWDNRGEIFVGQKRYVISNINFHLEKEVFLSQLGKDSTLIYEKNRFSKVYVNGRLFKYLDILKDNKSKLHEIIYEGKNISLLKSFSVSFIERSTNPMVNRPQSVLKQKSKYYVLKNEELFSFRPNKSSMKEFLDKDEFRDMKLYVKRYNLSFNKESNLNIIFKYCDNL